MFFLLYRHTDDSVFDDFSKIFDHFPKISEDSSKTCPKVTRTLPRYPKIAEDFRGRPEDVPIKHQRIEGQFKRQT